MRLIVYSLLATFFSLTLFACSPSEKKVDVPPPPKAEGQTSPAPSGPAQEGQKPESAKQIMEDYQKGLVTSIDKARGAQAKVDMGVLQDAVRNYQVENGRYPNNLDAVKSYVGPKVNLALYNYDPATGTVSLK